MQAFWFIALAAVSVLGFDNSRNDNLAVYWGQNSYGATHSDTANFQKTLSFYCADNSIDVFPLAFMDSFFSTGGLPHIDLSNICNANTGPVFAGSQLANCQFLASDIQTCQSKGKIVTLSIGGGAASGVFFTSASQAASFGDQVWNLFLGGNSSTRPFGSAVLDGIDLDIEGGSTQFFDSFVNQIRSHAAGASKKYYLTAAPQCPFPDAYMGSVLNAVAFDAVYVQFYNNYCSLPNFNNPQDWDFSLWDNWAKNTAVNPNVKIYIGAPGSTTAANAGSYVDAGALGTIIQQTRAAYSSFGGVMMWDASQAYNNGRFDAAVKSLLTNGGGSTPSNPVTSKPPTSTSTRTTTSTSTRTTTSTSRTTTSRTTTTSSPPVTSGSCAGVAAWSSNVAYNGGQQVVYNGHLWTAKWWSESDTPGGSAGVWTDNGACTVSNAVHVQTAAATDVKVDPAITKASSANAHVSSRPAKVSTPEAKAAAVKTDVAASGPTSMPLDGNTSAEEAKTSPKTVRRASRFFRA